MVGLERQNKLEWIEISELFSMSASPDLIRDKNSK